MSFHEVRLPARLAFGSTGGVERRTEITTLASGFERRSTPWAMGRRRYLIGANLRSLDDMAELTAFFEARRGRVRILDGEAVVRTLEVEDETALYAAADVAADWPGGLGEEAVVAVAQWGAGFGWGVEATARLNTA